MEIVAAPVISFKFKRRGSSDATHCATENPSPPPPSSGEPSNLVEAPALVKRRWDQVEEELEEGSEKKPRRTRYPPPKRRKVSAVRKYPAGGGFTVVACTPSFKTKNSDAEEPEEEEEVVHQQPGDEGCVHKLERLETHQRQGLLQENQQPHTENAEMEVEKVETERRHELIQEKNGKVKAVVYPRLAAAEGSVRVTCTENARIVGTKQTEEFLRQKDGEKSKVKLLSRPEDSVRVASTEKPRDEARRNAKQFRKRIREITNESRSMPASKEITVKERIEKKFSVRPGMERKLEGHESWQLGKSLSIEEARESNTSPTLSRDDAKRNVKQFNPASKGSLGEITGKERIEKKISVRPGWEMKLEGHESWQLGKSLSIKEVQESQPSLELSHDDAKRNVKQFKPASKGSLGVITGKERIEKKFTVRPGMERKLEGHESWLLGKSLSIKEVQESQPSLELSRDDARRNVKQFKPASKGSLGEITGKGRIEKKISVRPGSEMKLEGLKTEQLGKSLSIKEAQESQPSLELSRDEARRNVKETRARAQEKCNENRILVRSNLERKLEGHDRKQFGKSLPIKEAQESKPSPELRTKSGIKIIIKVGGSEVGNLVADPKFVKRKLAEEADNRVCVSSNKIVGLGGLKTDGDKRILQTQISAENYPPRQARKSSGTIKHSVGPENLMKRGSNNSDFKGASASRHKYDENEKDSAVYKLPPVVPLKRNHKASCNEYVSARSKVKRALRLFQVLARTLLQGDEKSKVLGQRNRIDLKVAGILKDNNQWVNRGKPVVGAVPGVEVGDEFHYRVELSIVGLHRPFQGGIDRTKKKSVDIATSIVASGGYPDDMDSSGVLIYNGSGGTANGKNKELGDQKLERGNLALKNSMDVKNPVRVIHGFKEIKESEHDGRIKPVSTFTYDGLYLVEKYWTEIGPHGFSVFKFQLRRMSGQPELALKEAKRSKMAKVREGLFQKDISQGKETMPICALNTTDDDRPTPFRYITKNIYPAWYVHKPPRGCDCTDGCLDNEKCACAVKNGGGIPFNHNGAIVQAKPLVYECGPSCKCRSCYNRVSQHGVKIPLEIFKTKSRGWGVRSLYSIPSGSFICEYVGELLKESDAQDRVNDEYLFEISCTYEDMTLLEGIQSLIPGLQSNFVGEPVADVGFTIDAAKYGNIGRFINHSCSPNIYAQNVLFDHDDKRMPHIMFFAADNIPPLQELTYDYNYRIDQVHDSEGNIKRKNCYCGSAECTGRLY